MRRTLAEVAHLAGYALVTGIVLKVFVLDACHVQSGSMLPSLQPGDMVLVNKFAYGVRTPARLPFLGTPLTVHAVPSDAIPAVGDVVVFLAPESELPLPSVQPSALYVKRCMAGPGDTVAIREGVFLLNGRPVDVPGLPGHSPVPAGWVDSRIFPPGAPFNADNYGPLVVPRRGTTVSLSASSLPAWERLIQHEGHMVGLGPDSGVRVDGAPCASYTFTQDYFFMLGDNRRESFDSRFWGPVAADQLIGKAMLVYWSVDGNAKGFWGRLAAIRWGRLGTLVR